MRHRIVILMILAVLLSVVTSCEKVTLMPGEEKAAEETAKEPQPKEGLEMPASVSVPTVVIQAGEKAVNVNVEVAVTPDERARGLMGRQSLPENYGMWFVFPYDVLDPFWMKDTLIPLDIIFIGPDLKVVDIIENAVPQSEERLYSRAAYRYVLEVKGGFASANGIKIGNVVEQRLGPR